MASAKLRDTQSIATGYDSSRADSRLGVARIGPVPRFGHRCPDCGGPLAFGEGCSLCPICGHSSCA